MQPEVENIVVNDCDTAKAGKDGKELRVASRKVAEAGVVENFFVKMKKEGVGTHAIESRARKFQTERDSKEGKGRQETISEVLEGMGEVESGKSNTRGKMGFVIKKSNFKRDVELVRHLVDIKVKSATEFRKGLEKNYTEAWKEFEKNTKPGSRKWRKMYGEVRNIMTETWKTEEKKFDRKLKNLKTKYTGREHLHREERSREEKELDEILEKLEDNEKEILDGLWLTDGKLDEEIKKTWPNEPEIPVYGEVRQLRKEEIKLLRKPPKHAVYNKLNVKEFEKELEAVRTKIRYSRMEASGEMDSEEEDEMDEDTEEEMRMAEVEARETYDPDRGKLNMTKKRATDIRTNQRIIMPLPRPTKEECDLEVRTGKLLDRYKMFMKQNCTEKGEQLESNMTKSEKLGMKMLQERIKENEIVIKETDKSHKFCVSSWQNYIGQGKEHVKNDREISRKEVERMERRINLHTKYLLGFLRVGEGLGKSNKTRISSAYCANTGVVPVLATHVKDHKPPPPRWYTKVKGDLPCYWQYKRTTK